MKRLASILLIWLPLFSQGQITVDGDCGEAAWRILALVNSTGTPNTGFTTGNTLGVIKYHSNSTTLFIAVTGDITDNNHIVLFMDDVSYGGRGTSKLGANMTGVASSVFRTSGLTCPSPEPNGLAGAILDAGFDADYAFAINKGNTATTIFMDAVRYSNYLNDGVTASYFAGPVAIGTCNQSGATAGYPVAITGWNSSGNNISFAWQNGYNAGSAPNKGIEIAIPYASLPGVALGHQMRFFALITDFYGLASNICIPGDPNIIGNAGSPSNLGCAFNVSPINNPGKDIFYTDPLVVLPLSFLGLKSAWEGERVRLDWSVAEQGESNYYYIERSADGSLFEPIGFLTAMEQGSVSQYHFIDQSPLGGRNIYRVMARKRDGKSVYSKTVSIENQSISPINVFPNPATDKVFIRMTGFAGMSCKWTIHNELGQPVQSGILSSAQTIECLPLPPSLPSGTYRLTLVSEGKIASRQLQIRR